VSPFSLESVLYTGAIGLVVIGALGLVLSNHLLRMVLALSVAEAGGNLLLVLAGYRGGAVAPIIGYAAPGTAMVDPVPQALVLTAIVIGVGVQAGIPLSSSTQAPAGQRPLPPVPLAVSHQATGVRS
jgi:multisubunit Na+/H+ antiporter MnhC subunit